MDKIKHVLEEALQQDSLETKLKFLNDSIQGKVVFSTSFGFEDQVITHAILSQHLQNIQIFTLDTGRVFPETLPVLGSFVIMLGFEVGSKLTIASEPVPFAALV